MDTWVLRQTQDLDYVERLSAVGTLSSSNLTELFSVRTCYTRPLLQINFRFLKRQRSRCSGKRSTGALERFLGSRYGILADHSRHEVRHLSRTGRMRVVPLVPTWFKEFEVPHGLDVNYGPSLVFDGLRLLRSPSMAQSSSFGSEWLAQTAAEYMLTLYSSFKLYRLTDTLMEYIRLADLSFVLGNTATRIFTRLNV